MCACTYIHAHLYVYISLLVYRHLRIQTKCRCQFCSICWLGATGPRHPRRARGLLNKPLLPHLLSRPCRLRGRSSWASHDMQRELDSITLLGIFLTSVRSLLGDLPLKAIRTHPCASRMQATRLLPGTERAPWSMDWDLVDGAARSSSPNLVLPRSGHTVIKYV